MNPIRLSYQVFCLNPQSPNQLLTATLPTDQVISTKDSIAPLQTLLPMEIENSVICELVTANDQWYIPILLWIKAKSEELFDALEFVPWSQAVSMDEPLRWSRINQRLNRFLGRNQVCAIVGCKETSQRFSEEVQEQAYQAGRMAALCGYIVLTGGLSGVMTKAAQGAVSIGGTTIGILPGTEKSDANHYIQNVMPSGIGIARNYQIALGCDVMIAVNGGRGTMEEMCFALDFDKPVLSWNSWEIDGTQRAMDSQDVFRFLLDNKEDLLLNLFNEVNLSLN